MELELKNGSEKCTLDDKGRVLIPSEFREHFQGDLVITWGMERCAWIMTPPGWERFEQVLRNSETLTQEERLVLEDKYLNQAKVVKLKDGRLAIPPTIRSYANLTKDCMAVRTKNRLAIWDKPTYDAYLAEKDPLSRVAMNKLPKDVFGDG